MSYAHYWLLEQSVSGQTFLLGQAAASWPIPDSTFKDWERRGEIIAARRSMYGKQDRRVFVRQEIDLYGRIIVSIQQGDAGESERLQAEMTSLRRRMNLPDASPSRRSQS